MSDEELCFLSIEEVSRLIASRVVSPVAVVQATLDRIERLNGTLGAYITVMGEAALDAARVAEAEIGRGEYRGPLHGIPVSLKDLIYVKGVRNTSGSRAMVDFVPTYDATVVERLRAAGAIVLGKANLHEFGAIRSSYPFGRTPTPWDLSRVSTGSSSGSAAGVAAGLCHASIGTDRGGSVRGPASTCGVVGLKPTYGRVSRYGGSQSWSMGHLGPITRTVKDCALVMNAIAGYDPRDPTTVNVPVPDYTRALDGEVRGLRIGLPKAFFFDDLDPEFEVVIRQAIELLESAGATLHEVGLPTVRHALAAHAVIVAAEVASVQERQIRTNAHSFESGPRERAELGSLLMATDYLKAQRVRAVFQREFALVMERVDVLLSPTYAGPPLTFEEALGEIEEGRATRKLPNRSRRPFNQLGAPALSVPCGFSAGGIPVGLQIAAKPMEDELVLKVAHAYEQRTEWHERRPPVG